MYDQTLSPREPREVETNWERFADEHQDRAAAVDAKLFDEDNHEELNDLLDYAERVRWQTVVSLQDADKLKTFVSQLRTVLARRDKLRERAIEPSNPVAGLPGDFVDRDFE